MSLSSFRPSLLVGCLLLCACPQRPLLLGTLKGLVQAEVAQIHGVTLELLRDSEPMVEQETCEDRRSLIQSRYADGVTATIEIIHLTDKVSTVEILIGKQGDRIAARHLFDRIKQAVENNAHR